MKIRSIIIWQSVPEPISAPVTARSMTEMRFRSFPTASTLHYIIKYKGQYIELQGRTLFEEGWGEVDHDIVYKNAEDDEMLRDYSKLLNRLSGLADEMSSYFRRLKHEREQEE